MRGHVGESLGRKDDHIGGIAPEREPFRGHRDGRRQFRDFHRFELKCFRGRRHESDCTSPGQGHLTNSFVFATENRADFVHKIRLAAKEVRESRYWLNVIQRAKLLDKHLSGLLREDRPHSFQGVS